MKHSLNFHQSLWFDFEGPSCTGKTTILRDYLVPFLNNRGIRSVFTEEPNVKTVFGEIIRKLIDGQTVSSELIKRGVANADKTARLFNERGRNPIFWKETKRIMLKLSRGKALEEMEHQMLFMADGYVDLNQNLRPSLDRGISVFQARYRLSTRAFGLARGLSLTELKRWEYLSLGRRARYPDAYVYIRISPATAYARLEACGKIKDRFEAKLESIKRTCVAYEKVIEDERAAGGQVVVVDGEPPFVKVTEDIQSKALGFYESQPG